MSDGTTSDFDTRARTARAGEGEAPTRLHGVVIGMLVGFEAERPLVAFPGNPLERAVPARSTCVLGETETGGEVALLFEQGDPLRPVIVGPLQRPGAGARHEDAVARQKQEPAGAAPLQVDLDGQRITLRAEQELVLRCGDASITLTRSGKILLRGTYLSSRSTGVNKIKGGSIQLN